MTAVPSFSLADLKLLVWSSCIYLVTRWMLESTATWLSHACWPAVQRQGKLPGDVKRLNEALWKFVCHSFFVVLVTSTLSSENQRWVRTWDTRQMIEGWPEQEHTDILRWVCTVRMAYYVAGSGMILTAWEVPRKDTHVVLFHHALAFVIVGLCTTFNYTRGCCVGMVLFDINDVLFQMAKLSHYNELTTLSRVLFILMVLSWVALRTVAYPLVALRCSLFDSIEILKLSLPWYLLFNGLLIALYCVQFFWLRLMLANLVQLARTGTLKDMREKNRS